MKNKFRVLLTTASLLAVLVGTLGISLPAAAAAPTIENLTGTLDGSLDCGDFTAVGQSVLAGTVTYFYNSDGVLIRYHQHGLYQDHLMNPLNGKVIYSREEGWNVFEDVADNPGVQKAVGLMYHYVLPGRGGVVIDTGVIYFDLTDFSMSGVKGRHEYAFADPASMAKLCAALR